MCGYETYKRIAIIGAGASGCLCAYFLLKNGYEVTLFDKSSPLRTLLPTGGGRCNLAHAEFDFKELAKNYPRGEKFLYSVFLIQSFLFSLKLKSHLFLLSIRTRLIYSSVRLPFS